MAVTRLQIKNIGPLESADLEFGDLTVLVGPQATGKSICLQLLKLLVDTGAILSELGQYGLEWNRELGRFLDIYLGEGMGRIWSKQSSLQFAEKRIDLSQLVSRKRQRNPERMFFIPAQRVLTIGRGWPRPFSDYDAGDPFCVRDFSEKLRRLMETGLNQDLTLFPQPRRMKTEIRNLLSQTIFSKYDLSIDVHGSQKRLVLNHPGTDAGQLPFMVWSAGQREFVPLLLGFYWVCPSSQAPRRDSLRWVVIEEMEMGLHPQAISTVIVLVLELLRRNYRVCLSTHSPHVLDVVWGLRTLQEHRGTDRHVLEMLGLKKTPQTNKIAKSALRKSLKVFLFDRASHQTRDISKLDPGSDDAAEAGWGGLTEFSGRVADVVADVVGQRP